MPTANAMTVSPPSHGMAGLAIFRNRDGLARSTIAIAILSSTFCSTRLGAARHSPFTRQPHLQHASFAHQSGCYSISSRSAAAAAKGPTTRLASDNPHNVMNGVSNGIGPLTAALGAATPQIRIG